MKDWTGQFEWDERKNRKTIKDRGIDFNDIKAIFIGPTLEFVDKRKDYGEERIIAYGQTQGVIFAVIYTMRGTVCRIISARIANRHEQADYLQAIAEDQARGKD
jgi:uncharacterized DUF497 family protein